jgi:glycosyltransferase involved in cell wall biosynthesis
LLLLAQQFTQGGSERQLVELATHLDRTRFDPHAGCMREGGLRVEDLRRAGVPVCAFPMRTFLGTDLPRAAAALRRYIRAKNIGIVHSFDVPMNLLAAPTARSVPGVLTVTSQRAFRSLAPATHRRLLRATDRLAHGIVVNCRALRHHLEHDEGVSASKIHLCYNGLDASRFPLRTRAAGGAVVMGAVCALRPEKNLPALMRAFLRLRAQHRDIRLLIVGDGSEREVLARMANAESAAVEFHPAVADVVPWFHRIDIFVLPSRSEALSNSLMEAMACGCAVVASNAGGSPELVDDGKTGLLFPAGDDAALAACLSRLISDPGLRQSLAGAGAERVRRDFTVDATTRRMADIYGALLPAAGRRGAA